MSDKENLEEFQEEIEIKPKTRRDNEILGAFFKELPDEEDEEKSEDETEEEEEEQESTEEEEEMGDEDETEEEEKEEEEGENEEEGEGEDRKTEKEKKGGKEALDKEGKPLNSEEDLSRRVRIKVNDEVREVPVKELIKDAQRAKSADEKYQQAARQTKQALTIIDHLKSDPLGTFYSVVANEKGDSAAYQEIAEHCKRFLGREMEWLALPEAERLKRQNEAAMARKDAEINRLKNERENEARAMRAQMLARQIKQEAQAAGLPQDRDTLMQIADIFDGYEAHGDRVSVRECVRELVHRRQESFKRQISSLSDDELKRLNLSRKSSRNGDKRMRPGRALRVRKRPQSSTGKAKTAEKKEPPRKYYSSFKEAWEAAQEEDRQARKRG